MGQKVNPHGLRVGVIKDWDSRWFTGKRNFGNLIVEDYKVRKFLKNRLYAAGISKIEIERNATKTKFHIHCAKPGIVIGKGGAEIEKLKAEVEKMVKGNVYINIVEVRSPDKNAQLVAENIASQLERRVSFRRATLPKPWIAQDVLVELKSLEVKVIMREQFLYKLFVLI